MLNPEDFHRRAKGSLPDHLGIVVTEVAVGRLRAELAIVPFHMASNGYLHAGTVVTLADTSAGYGCIASLPEGASGFTTIELKCNYLGTARAGHIDCVATAAHMGKSTQVWDSVVTHRESGKTIALFRCTEMILYARP